MPAPQARMIVPGETHFVVTPEMEYVGILSYWIVHCWFMEEKGQIVSECAPIVGPGEFENSIGNMSYHWFDFRSMLNDVTFSSVQARLDVGKLIENLYRR